MKPRGRGDRSIDVLERHRQALITHAATQAIDGVPGAA